MPWTIDPQFGSTFSKIDAFSPFSVGGGNKVLCLNGVGLAYRTDFNIVDTSIFCDLVVKNYAGAGSDPSLPRTIDLIARRQADGSFYSAMLMFSNQPFYKEILTINKYNGTLDTWTQLVSYRIDSTVPELPISSLSLLTFTFKVVGTSMLARVMNGTTIIGEAGATDSTITASGNPGIGSNIFFPAATSNSFGVLMYADNLIIKQVV